MKWFPVEPEVGSYGMRNCIRNKIVLVFKFSQSSLCIIGSFCKSAIEFMNS